MVLEPGYPAHLFIYSQVVCVHYDPCSCCLINSTHRKIGLHSTSQDLGYMVLIFLLANDPVPETESVDN